MSSSTASGGSSSPAPLTPNVWDTMLASTMAGMAARIPLHPLDTLKAKLQVAQQFRSAATATATPAAAAAGAAAHVPTAAGGAAAAAPASGVAGVVPSRSLWSLARHTLRAEGVRGLYSGFGVTFFGSAPAACIYFTSYEASKSTLSTMPLFRDSAPFFSHFASGLVAEAAACVLWVPVDVVKERLQVQHQLRELMAANATAHANRATAAAAAAAATATSALPVGAALPSSLGPLLPSAAPMPPAQLYRGNLDAIATIARTEGIKGIYRGYGATLASFGPFSAIYFSGYEQCKEAYVRWVLPEQHQQRLQRSANAAAAAALRFEEAGSSASEGMVQAAATGADAVDLGFLGFAFCGGAAGCVASVLTNPMDLVKLRMQVQRGNSGFTFGYKNMVDGMRQIIRQEGAASLFRGAGARCLFHVPSTAITIAIVDTLKQHVAAFRQKLF